MDNTPTPSQLQLLNVIRSLREKHEYGPTSLEIAKAMKANINTTKTALRGLKEKKLVRLAHGGRGYIES